MEYNYKISQETLHQSCRVCLYIKEDMQSFFLSEFVQQLRECTGIDAFPDHRLPSKICSTCADQLTSFHTFYNECHRANAFLKSFIEVKQEIKTEKEYDPFHSDNDTSTSFPCKDENPQDINSIEMVKAEESDHENLKETKERMRKESLKSASNKSSKYTLDKIKMKGLKIRKKGKKCHICSSVLPNQAALIAHMDVHDMDKPHVCSHCDRRFMVESALKSHITKIHSGPDPKAAERQTCEECKKTFGNAKHLKIHMRIHTGEMPYQCTTCMRRFTQIGSLISHRRIHTGEKPFVCHLCGRAFSTRAHLRRHQSVHSKEKPFACTICDKKLKSAKALIQHNKLHTNEKDHVCELCGYSFLAKINLDKHRRLKHSEKSGQCNICKKICANLKDHMVIHTGEKPYQCKICDKKFPSRRGLTIHGHKHKFPDKYKCDLDGCDRTFDRRWVFDCHLREHTGEMPYSCEFCPKSYPRICHLTQHLKLSHPNESLIRSPPKSECDSVSKKE